MQVKCYDCGRLVSHGEAVQQKEGGGNVGGGGYGRGGWGAGGGSWKIACDRKRVENRRFWQWVMVAVILGIVLVVVIVCLIAGKNNK